MQKQGKESIWWVNVEHEPYLDDTSERSLIRGWLIVADWLSLSSVLPLTVSWVLISLCGTNVLDLPQSNGLPTNYSCVSLNDGDTV
jgi:hypothetical protein